MRRHALVLVAFLVGAIIVTFPLALDPSRSVIDEGDPLFTSWILGWVNHALLTSPSRLFDAPIFYPEKKTLAYSESLLLPSALTSPVFALGGSAILANNCAYLISFVLGGWFFYLMCVELGLGSCASILGATLFAFSAFRMDFSHLQLSQVQYIPLQVLLVHRYFREHSIRYLVAAWIALLATSLSCSYYGVYALLLMAILHLYFLPGDIVRRRFRSVAEVIAAPLPTLVGLYLYYRPYAAARQMYGFERSPGALRAHNADLADYATSSVHNLTLSRLGPSIYSGVQHALSPGIVATMLVLALPFLMRGSVKNAGLAGGWARLLALAVTCRRVCAGVAIATFVVALGGGGALPRGAFRVVLLSVLLVWLAEILVRAAGDRWVGFPHLLAWIALLAAALSLGTEMKCAGHDVGPGIYDLLSGWFPGLWGIRVVNRISLLFFLCFFTLAAYSVQRLERKGWMTNRLFVLLLVLTLVERLNAPIPWVRFDEHDPEAYQWLSRQPGGGAVLELPLKTELGAYRYMYESLHHGHPLVNGVSGFVPPGYFQRVKQLETYPGTRALDLLQGLLPLEFIVWHRESASQVQGNRYEGLDRIDFLRKEVEYGRTAIYSVQHGFRDERPRELFELYLDPRYMAGRTVRFEVAEAAPDRGPLSLDLRIGDKVARTLTVHAAIRVAVRPEDVPPGGAWIKLTPSQTQAWTLASYELVSDVSGHASAVWLEENQFKPKYANGLLVVVSNGRGEPALQRSYDTKTDKAVATKLKTLLRKVREERYLFLVVSGDALREADPGLRDVIQGIAGKDPGRAALAVVRIAPGRAVERDVELHASADEHRATIRSEAAQFIISDLRQAD